MTETICTSSPGDRHRDVCAVVLGINPGLLAEICNWRRRGDVVPHRERLIVAMRDTPADSGLRFSFPEIARALRAKNHSTIITAYQRGKAKAEVKG